MTEHEFPLDADPALRKHVKMEIERETAEIKLSEMRVRFIGIAWRTLISFLIAFAACAVQSPNITAVQVFVYTISFSIVASFTLIVEVISNWRDMARAKRELRSWNEVVAEYNNKIKEEDSLRE